MLATVFVNLLGANPGPAAAIYMTLRSNNVQKDAFAAVVDGQLPESDATLFDRVFKRYEGCAKARNELAHHLWGFDKRIPDKLILADPKKTNRLTVEMAELQDRGIAGFDTPEKSEDAIKRLHDAHTAACKVWSLDDFKVAHARNTQLFKLLVQFSILVSAEDDAKRETLRHQLSQMLETS